MQYDKVDPDDLFIRFTIPEIRTVQSRLRADADAKQEELRLMVGERYRDLLQASTSIISIAKSSRRVTEALAEMRDTMTPDEPWKPRSSSIRGKNDAHLKVLQSLSAHLKLLLDAPEHLWRLLEKKQYLQATWLFLLARVVHRAMITEDPEETTWQTEGINVLAQFPLVQRQWDTIAQLRPQIAHRAAQNLREYQISPEGACSTILTLHLLDSLPLTETLSVLLSQRSKTLNALLSRNLDFRTPSRPGSPIFKSRQRNPEVTGMLLAPPSSGPRRPRNRREVVRDVREAVLELLEVIWGTMGIARELFQNEEGRRRSMVERSLEDIQNNASPESAITIITTSTLLSTLPSSTHLLTLPPSVLSYKPYIDLASPGSHVDPSILYSKLSIWFNKAMEGFAGRLRVWFSGLESIREAWSLRQKVLERLQAVQGLDKTEKVNVQSVLENIVKERMCGVASASLEGLERRLDSTLRSVVQEIREGVEISHLDTNPSGFLISPPPIPSLLQMSSITASGSSPFGQLKNALRQRVNGRTPAVDRVLGEIEAKAQEMEDNLNVMHENGLESRNLQDEVMIIYHQAAHASSTRICQILERIITEELVGADKEPDQVGNAVIFLGRLCYYMSLSSCIRGLCYRNETAQAFHETLNALHERSIDFWRDHAVSTALKECDSIFDPFNAAAPEEFVWPSEPSSHLIHALLSLISSLGRLGLSRSALVSKGVTTQITLDFQSAVAQRVSVESCDWTRDEAQLLWDLTFLRKIFSSPTENFIEADDPLTGKLSRLYERLHSADVSEDTISKFQTHIDRSIDKYLPRSQSLLAPLLVVSIPRKLRLNDKVATTTSINRMTSTALLPLGVPKADQDFWPAIETVKPSIRFGMVLVGSTAM